jgi:hypothetical protein
MGEKSSLFAANMEGDVVMSNGHGFSGNMVAGGMVVLQIVAISDEQNSLLEEKMRLKLKTDNDKI